MRVFEPFTLDLEILVEGGEGCDVVGIEGKPDGLMVTAIARLQELDSDDCGLGGDRDQLEEPLGGRDLAVFEIEALRLETRKNCSISQRRLYHSTMRQASSAFATG